MRNSCLNLLGNSSFKTAILGTLFFCFATFPSFGKFIPTDKYYEKAHYFYSIGAYVEAEAEIKQILQIKRNRKSIDKVYINLLLLQTRSVLRQFRFKDAANLAGKAENYAKIITKVNLKIEGNLLLCDYLLEQGDVQHADYIFNTYIPDTLITSSNLHRVHADANLIKGIILMQQGYQSKAISYLNTALTYFGNHLKELPEKERYFLDEALNENALKEKYALAMYSLALVQLKSSNFNEAESKIRNLIAWAKDNFPKENPYRYRPYKLLGKFYEVQGDFEKAVDAYEKVYVLNLQTDNEYEKQEALLEITLKSNEYGYRLSSKNYIRRLEMKSAMNIGSKESSQFAYELCNNQNRFLDQAYKTSYEQLTKLESTFSFVSKSHHYFEALHHLKKEVLYYQGHYNQYIEFLQKLAKLKSRYLGVECPEYHKLQLEVAMAEIAFGQELQKAKRIFVKSYFHNVEQHIEPVSADNIEYLQSLAQLHYRTSNYDSAFAIQKNATDLALQYYSENGTKYMLALAKKAEFELYIGDYTACLADLEKLETLTISKKGLNVTNLELQLQVAQLNRMVGNLAKSKLQFTNVKKLKNTIVNIPFCVQARVESGLSQFYLEEGNFFRAGKTSAAAKIESEQTSGKKVPWLNPLYETEAKVNMVTGNFVAGNQIIGNAFATIKEGTFEQSQMKLVQCDYFLAISDYTAALEVAQLADDIRKKRFGESHFYRSESLAKIAQIKSLMPDAEYQEIENIYSQAISLITNSIGSQNVHYFKTEQKLAEFYLRNLKNTSALTLLTRDLVFWENLGNNYLFAIASIKGLIGTAYYQQTDYENAGKYYEEASSTYRLVFNDKHPDFLKVQSKLARVFYMKNESPKAILVMQGIVNNAIEYSKKYFSSLSFRQRNRYWNSFKEEFEFYTFLMIEKNVEANSLNINNLYNVIISTKGMLLSSDIKLKRKIMNGRDTVLTRIYLSWQTQKELLTYSASMSEAEQKEQGISPKNIEQQIEKLEKELGQRSDIFKAQGKKNAINVQTIENVLNPNEYAVEIVRYRVFDKVFTDSVKYAAIILSKSKEPQIVVLPNGKFLERKLLKYYRNSIIYGSEDDLSYQNYWKPLKEQLKDSATVYLSGEGVFNQINIETLLGNDGKYAFEKNQFVYLTNTKDIVTNVDKSQKSTPNKGGYMLCGNPAFYSTEYTGKAEIPSLTGAEVEVKVISDILVKNKKKAYLLTAKDLHEASIRKMFSPKVFHIATHGYFKEDVQNTTNEDHNPLLNSGLLLVNSGDILANKENEFINKKDGVLTAYEALDLNFDQTEMVVLSACETGRGEVQAGEGVYGLQRSFLIAGAKAVILSLFKVNDDVTQLLMKEFYTRWLLNNNAREAFIYAKAKIKESYPQPIYWGAFVMVESDPKNSELTNSSMARNQ